MKNQTSQIPKPNTASNPVPKGTEGTEREFIFYIPPGYKLDDVYIDAQDVSEQLKVCKRVVTNLRKAGKLSYTTLDKGKIYYFKQEIAAQLKANTVIGKSSLMRRSGVDMGFTI
ncbi:MAG: helix-turn-helix domain-containing protein [Ginsengibacter sp.]